MARPTLTILITKNEACTTMTLADTTADYGGGTVTTASVEQVVIVVRNKSNDSYFTYTFTVVSNLITAATLSLNGGTATTITSELSSTAWPFIVDVNEFDLWGDYGVTLPDFDDAVIQPEYTITRTTAEAYSYTTSKTVLIDCNTCCCITKLGASLDPGCDCSTGKRKTYDDAYTWLHVAKDAAAVGNVSRAVEALRKASELCSCACTDC